MNKKLQKEFYKNQLEILNLLEKSNHIVELMINEPVKEYYMLRYDGCCWGRKTYKYVQKHFGKRPHIVSDMGYTRGCNVLFENIEDAVNFMRVFLNSKSRSQHGCYEKDGWKVVKVQPKVLEAQKLKKYFDYEYGFYLV